MTQKSASDSERVRIIQANQVERHYWTDLWHYRELFAILAWRDVAIRYKQTVIGVAWAVIKPLLSMIIFTFVFGRVAKLPSDGDAPYALMVYAGLLPWFLFSTILAEGSNSLVANARLVGKIYFPRIIVPTATSFVSLVDFAINVCLLFLLMAIFTFWPGFQILFLPIVAILGLAAALGPALLFAALNVRYRDFRFVIPFVVQFGLFASPVGYTSDVVPDQFRLLFSLNPMVGVIDAFRWCVLGPENSQIWWPGFLVSCSVITVFLWLGIRYFRKVERSFADVI